MANLLSGNFAHSIFHADALGGFHSLKVIQLPLHGASRQAKEARKLIFGLTNQHRSPDQISFEGRTKARSAAELRSAMILTVSSVEALNDSDHHAVNDGSFGFAFDSAHGRPPHGRAADLGRISNHGFLGRSSGMLRNLSRPLVCKAAIHHPKYPLWVRSGHPAGYHQCLLYPKKPDMD